VHFLKMLASTMRDEPKVIVIAGPNGAGKTTFARESFAFETTLAGHNYIRHIRDWQATIRRRFAAGLENFKHLYAPLVDSWALYDNSGAQPRLIDWDEKP
jgi:predicted ABC-type ATPase